MARNYHTLNWQTRASEEEKLTSLLKKNGQPLLPMVDLITPWRMAIDELIDSVGRATLETILEVFAEQVVGARQPGNARAGVVGWYGRQPGRVYLGDRKLAVERPRLHSTIHPTRAIEVQTPVISDTPMSSIDTGIK